MAKITIEYKKFPQCWIATWISFIGGLINAAVICFAAFACLYGVAAFFGMDKSEPMTWVIFLRLIALIVLFVALIRLIPLLFDTLAIWIARIWLKNKGV